MDAARQRIQEDLRGQISGDVFCDDLYLQMYANDASVYEIRPLGVVRPRHRRDVIACVKYAAENQIPLHARGAGTGLAGESLGRGLVIDFSRHMRRIIRTEEDTVRVQPGVVHGMLNRQLAKQGRIFGPDPAMSHVTTMGSVIAVDAGGSHWLRYGSARQQVASLEIVLSDGTLMEVGRESLATLGQIDDERRRDLIGQLSQLIQKESEAIAHYRPESLVNRAGYNLHDVLDGEHLNLARLLAGSEGTLALITEATLYTSELPKSQGVALFLFESLEKAAQAAVEVRAADVAACDLMDRRHLSLARESDVRYDLLIPSSVEAVLLVEQDGESMDQVRDSLNKIIHRIQRRLKLSMAAHLASDVEEAELYWKLARRFVPTLYQLKGSTRPLPFVEDVAVPPDQLIDFLVRMQNVLKRHQVIASLFGHVGHGQLHIRPFLDLANQADVDRMHALAQDLYEEVWDVGGTISGEHALGLSRTPFLREQCGPLIDVFREVKRLFDPLGILNPAKVVTSDPLPINQNLRKVSLAIPDDDTDPSGNGNANNDVPLKLVELQMAWSSEEMTRGARLCNGCGACRTQQPEDRMCPILRIDSREEASPRSKANLARGLLTGTLDPQSIGHDEFKQIADLCVHCHQCRLECPASVDIPKLMAEVKGMYVRANGMPTKEWLMARVDSLSRWISKLPRLANWAIRNRSARWLAEKTLGIAQGRKLPQFANRNFLRIATRRRLTRTTRRSGLKVLYFVDTYANYHDPELAEAMVNVFEHNGIAVYVSPKMGPAGMSLINSGAIDRAAELAARNVTLLAEAVRQGYHIVATEPAAALCLKHEYKSLLNDEDVQLVAENSSEACQYLWRLHREGKLLLDFKPVTAVLGYHLPCHVKALAAGQPGENLLRLIPGLSVRRIEKGCSGMAGTYGLMRKNYRSSLRAGWGLISALRDGPMLAGTTECSACKMQMEQATSKPTIHPLKLLAFAYGRMPHLGRHLTATGEELVIT